MTKIQWTEETWNPIAGCSIVSAGCKNCYAMKWAGCALDGTRRRDTGKLKFPHYEGTTKRVNGRIVWSGKVALSPEHILTKPLRKKKPTVYFVNSMGDLFHESIPDEWIDRVFAVMALCPQHTFQILTKRPARMREYLYGVYYQMRGRAANGTYFGMDHARAINRWRAASEHLNWFVDAPGDLPYMGHLWKGSHFPLPNVWLGTSVEDQPTAEERIPHLLDTPAALRFVSYEPALGPVDFERIMARMPGGGESMWDVITPRVDREAAGLVDDPLAATLLGQGVASGHASAPIYPRLDWIIVGGESGPGARPFDLKWARRTIAQCKAAGVPVFVKQLGAYPINVGDPMGHATWDLKDKKGGDPDEWPADLRVREMPRTLIEEVSHDEG